MLVSCTNWWEWAWPWVCEWSNFQTMVIELSLAIVIGFSIAWKFRSKILESVIKELHKKEKTRDIQILEQLLSSFKDLKSKMEGLQH